MYINDEYIKGLKNAKFILYIDKDNVMHTLEGINSNICNPKSFAETVSNILIKVATTGVETFDKFASSELIEAINNVLDKYKFGERK